ncbi:MAG: hypothetical protein HOP29_07835 [Phycisphaerales bacterium]|nr:hypothetical protein [Phycisphaerales bacterium]
MPKLFAPPRFKRVDHRGLFVEVIAEGRWESILHGRMHAGAVIGHHYHTLARLYFYLTSGEADVHIVRVCDGVRESFCLPAGEGVYLEPNEAHAICFTKASEFILAKSRRHDPADPDTIPYELEID